MELADKCAILESTGFADKALDEMPRDMLAQIFIMLSMIWKTEREENAMLRSVVASYEAGTEAGNSSEPVAASTIAANSGSMGVAGTVSFGVALALLLGAQLAPSQVPTLSVLTEGVDSLPSCRSPVRARSPALTESPAES